MGKQATEMLKGGSSRALCSRSCRHNPPTATRSPHNCAIKGSPTSPRAPSTRCSSGSSSGTSSTWKRFRPKRGPPRKVYTLNAQGRAQLNEFWRNWSFLAERIERLHKGRSDHERQVDRGHHRLARAEEAVPAVQGPHRGPSRTVRNLREGIPAVLHLLRGGITDGGDTLLAMFGDFATSGSAPRPTARRCGRSSATTRSSSPRRSRRHTPARSGSTRNAPASPRRSTSSSGRNSSEHPSCHPGTGGVEKSYEQLHVLRGVDFEVERGGSIFALLGSNGAGKTTLVKILATLLKPDAGTASVDGFEVTTEAANVRESISLTGQFAAVDEILSGRENLALVARLRHLKNPPGRSRTSCSRAFP